MSFSEGLKFQNAGATVDFNALLAGVRKLQPKCPDCGFPHADVFGEYRTRIAEDGTEEHVCNACALFEIGENLLTTLPQ